MFLLGDDERSRAWLRSHVETLRALHAVGFVVQVDSEAALQSLRQLAADLTLTPASGDDLAQRLGLTHYPVLITATAIEP
jgi:integrating conjugative element protein (TIGR03765 family)